MPAVMEAIDRMTTAEKFEAMDYIWASIYATLPSDADRTIQSEWLETAKRRRAEILAGRARTFPTSEVLAEARAKVGR